MGQAARRTNHLTGGLELPHPWGREWGGSGGWIHHPWPMVSQSRLHDEASVKTQKEGDQRPCGLGITWGLGDSAPRPERVWKLLATPSPGMSPIRLFPGCAL